MVYRKTVDAWGIDCLGYDLAEDGITVRKIWCQTCKTFYSTTDSTGPVVGGNDKRVPLSEKLVQGSCVVRKCNVLDHITRSGIHKQAVLGSRRDSLRITGENIHSDTTRWQTDKTDILSTDLHEKSAECDSDLPLGNVCVQIKTEIEEDSLFDDTDIKCEGEITLGTQGLSTNNSDLTSAGAKSDSSSSVFVDSRESWQDEIQNGLHQDKSPLFRKNQINSETRTAMSHAELTSFGMSGQRDVQVRGQDLTHRVVKQEILEMENTVFVHGPDMGVSESSFEDRTYRKPNLIHESASSMDPCMDQIQNTSTSQGVTPVGLYYNTAQFGHFVMCEESGQVPQTICRDNERENTAGGRGNSRIELCDEDVLDNDNKAKESDVNHYTGLTNDKTIDCNADHVINCGIDIATCIHHKQVQASETSVLSHQGETPHRCDICAKSFRHLCLLRIHKRTHEHEKPYALLRRALSQPINPAHTDERPYKCKTCNRSFSRFRDLDFHARTHAVKYKNSYTCYICRQTFPREQRAAHERSHGEMPYECDVCCKVFSDLISLRVHGQSHEKPFACPLCGKEFLYLSRLRVHKGTHRGEKLYTCIVCSKCFLLPELNKTVNSSNPETCLELIGIACTPL